MRRRWLFAVLLVLPLLACTPFVQVSGGSGGNLPVAGIPIDWSLIPDSAPCKVAALFGRTVDGLIYSQGGNLPNDPIDPATGRPYPRTGPNSYDCSGMTQAAYLRSGIDIGATTEQQRSAGQDVICPPDALPACLAVGDLIVFTTGTRHVMLYLGAGQFAECLNVQAGCRVWARPIATITSRAYSIRRIVGDCVQAVAPGPIAGGSWRGRGLTAATAAMGLSGARLTDTYGWRTHPITGASNFHAGIDLAIAEGTPLVALVGGVVDVATYSAWPEGNYVIIRAPSGQRTYYGHLRDHPLVLAGQMVPAGTPIGVIGQTGAATGPHLHFQMTDDAGGDWIDPLAYFGGQ